MIDYFFSMNPTISGRSGDTISEDVKCWLPFAFAAAGIPAAVAGEWVKMVATKLRWMPPNRVLEEIVLFKEVPW